MSSNPQRAYIHFVEIDDEVSGTLRICDAGQSEFPVETRWGGFHCLGDSLSFSGLKDGDSRSATNFRVYLGINTPEMVRTMYSRHVVDNDVCIHRAVGRPVDTPGGPQYFFSDPEILRLGRIGSVTQAPGGVVATCYTASADLSSVTTTATRWEDAQHRLLVDPEDYGFRFAARYWEDQGIITG